MTTDQGSDLGEFSSDIDTADESSPVRRVHKQFRSSDKTKPQHKKRMPPELKVTPAQVCTRNKSTALFMKMLSSSDLEYLCNLQIYELLHVFNRVKITLNISDDGIAGAFRQREVFN